MGDQSASKVPKQSDEQLPNEIFAKVLTNDRIQNKKLAGKLSKSYDVEEASSQQQKAEKASKARFIVCTLGLVSLAMSQMSRTVMNVTIVSMVDPSMIQTHGSVSADGSCPWPEEEVAVETPAPEICLPESTRAPSIDLAVNESTVVQNLDAETTMAEMKDEPTPDLNNQHVGPIKFKWTMKQQNVLLGSFFYSYFFFMILGGRISEIYGAKYVLLLGVAGSSLISLAVPMIASYSFYLLVFSRILMGCLQAGVFPGMYALISKWLTMSEASIYAPLIKMNLRLGMLLGSLVPGLISEWPNVFYLTGSLGITWSILWFFIASSDPADNRWVNELELRRILRKKKKKPTLEDKEPTGLELTDRNNSTPTKQSPKKPSTKTPWARILTNSSVIGLILVKVTFNCGVDFVSIEVPSYLKYVHHATREQISTITTGLFSIQVALVIFVGWLAKVMVQKKPFGLSKTGTRIFFQTISSGGTGLCMFLLTFNDCSLIYTAAFLLLISFAQMFTAGGETMLPYDLTEEYPATIMAIANSVSNTSGICVTLLAGFILGDQGGSYDRWNILIYLISGLLTFGAIMFALLIKAESVDFNEDYVKKEGKESPSAPPAAEVDSAESTHKSYKLDEDETNQPSK